MALGAVSMLFGVLALANAVAASLAVATLTGALLLIAGVVQAVTGWREPGTGHKAVSVGLGLLMAVLGLSFLIDPFQGLVSLTVLVTLLIGLGGIGRLLLAWTMRETRFFWLMLVSGALSILLAGVIAANFAAATYVLLGIIVGVELLFNGLALIVLALFLRAQDDG